MDKGANFAYRRDFTKKMMRQYAEQWAGLPLPRLQLRWAPKPVANSEPKRRADIALSKRVSRMMSLEYQPDMAWDCFYEMVLPVDRNDIRNELYGAGFIIIPISWSRRTGQHPPCRNGRIDDPFRDGAHAFWDSKSLGWLPIFVVAPDGSATMKATYHDQPVDWPAKAQAIEARRAATGTGAVHESAVRQDAPKKDHNHDQR